MAEPNTRVRGRRGPAVLGAAAVVTFTAVAAYVLWQHVRHGYTSAFMTATWAPLGDPTDHHVAVTITGRVTQWNGRPEVAQAIMTADDRGTHTAATDGDGRFAFEVAGRPSRLTVVGIDAIPLSRWNLPAGGGVAFEIHLKRPPPPSRGPL